MNYDGLKDTVIEMMAGARIPINIRNFTNDMMTFCSYEDILTLLVHLDIWGMILEQRKCSCQIQKYPMSMLQESAMLLKRRKL